MTLLRAGVLMGLAAICFVGCSDAPKEARKKAPEKPPEAVTGRAAFYKMYPSARMWAQDVQGLRLSSIRMEGVKNEPGKSGAWEATFVSPSKQKSKTFTYSVVEGPGNLHKDVFAGFDEDYRSPRGQATPWVIPAFKVDSDEAYATALKKSADYVKKNPNKPMFYLLEQTPRYPDLAWRIVWGESVSGSNYSVYVDATTGEYLETMR
jgi:hypothetical protein